MKHFRSSLILLVVLTLALLPTANGRAEEKKSPDSVTLYLSVSSAGEVNLTAGRMDAPVPGPAAGQPMPPNAIIVRSNGADKVFDLKDHPIAWIKFERSYYQATKLSYQDGALLLEITPSSSIVDIPNANLVNTTKVRTRVGDRSCYDSAFATESSAVVAYPVRLRLEPYVPLDINQNWIGSLYRGEKVRVIERFCNGGPWLRVQRLNGGVGWVKEWGLDRWLIQRTFIVTEAQFNQPAP